jgi:hypothetical protein
MADVVAVVAIQLWQLDFEAILQSLYGSIAMLRERIAAADAALTSRMEGKLECAPLAEIQQPVNDAFSLMEQFGFPLQVPFNPNPALPQHLAYAVRAACDSYNEYVVRVRLYAMTAHTVADIAESNAAHTDAEDVMSYHLNKAALHLQVDAHHVLCTALRVGMELQFAWITHPLDMHACSVRQPDPALAIYDEDVVPALLHLPHIADGSAGAAAQ